MQVIYTDKYTYTQPTSAHDLNFNEPSRTVWIITDQDNLVVCIQLLFLCKKKCRYRHKFIRFSKVLFC